MLPDYSKSIKFNSTNYRDFDLEDGSIGSIYITGGGFVNREFKGFGVDSKFGWQELVWKKTPPRNSSNFAMTTMDAIPVGLVARCELNCGYMNIDDYLALRKIFKQRHFYVTFFDIDDAEWVTREMYCTENSFKQFHIMKQAIIGNRDVQLKFAGTNNDLKEILNTTTNVEDFKTVKFTIKYNLNGGSVTQTVDQPIYEDKSVYYGQQIVLAPYDKLSPPDNTKSFGCWVQKNSNNDIVGYYGANQSITVWNDMNLYAVWNNIT